MNMLVLSGQNETANKLSIDHPSMNLLNYTINLGYLIWRIFGGKYKDDGLR